MFRSGMRLSGAPFIRLLLPLCLGVGLDQYSNLSALYAFLILACLLFVLLFLLKDVSYPYQPFWGLILFLTMLVFGFVRSKSEKVLFPVLSNRAYSVVLEEFPLEKSNSYQVVCQFFHSDLKIITYLPKLPSVKIAQPGDLLRFTGLPELVENEGNPYEFNYQRYLNHKKIGYRIFLRENQFSLVKDGSQMNIFRYALIVRDKLIHILGKSGMAAHNVPLVSSISFGAREEVDKEIIQSFTNTGVIHVLAVSGMNVGLVFIILDFLFYFLKSGRNGFLLHTMIVLLGIWSYTLITGMSASILRAAWMLTFVVVGRALHRNSNVYNSLAVSAFFLIAWNPFIIGDIGFQLSYAAVFSIAAFQPNIYGIFKLQNRLLDHIWQLLSVTLAAQIGTLPFTIVYFHQFPVYFWLANLLVIPMVTLVLYLSFVIIALSFVSAFLTSFFALILNWSIEFILWVVNHVSLFPHAVLKGLYPNIWQLVVLFSGAILFYYFLNNRRVILLQGVLVTLIFLFLSIGWNSFKRASRAEIIFFHLPGTRALALTENQTSIVLYDRGDTANGKLNYCLKPYLGARGINLVQLFRISDSLKWHSPNAELLGNFIFFRGIRLYVEPEKTIGHHLNDSSEIADLIWQRFSYRKSGKLTTSTESEIRINRTDPEINLEGNTTQKSVILVNKAVQLTIQFLPNTTKEKLQCGYFEQD